MRKLSTLIGYVFHALLYIIGNKTMNIDMPKVSITLKFH